MFFKKFIAGAITSVALVGVSVATQQIVPELAEHEVKADVWVNDYISANNIKPVGIEYRKGTFNRWFGYQNGIGKPQGVLIHDTATPGATAENEVAYFNNNWSRPNVMTYVHAFVDGNKIINIHDTNYGVWGAGPTANNRYIQVELCNVYTKDQFASSIANDAFYVASKLVEYNLPFKPNETVVTHRQAANWWLETNHRDPDGYLAKWGYDMNQFNQLIGKYYDNLKPAGNDGNAGATKPTKPVDPLALEGCVTVNDPDRYATKIFNFDENGVGHLSSRGLVNHSGWYTGQQRMYQGHKYYRVSTNEWVSDEYSSFDPW